MNPPNLGSSKQDEAIKGACMVAAMALAWLLLESVAGICRGHAQHQQHKVHVHAIRMPQGKQFYA